MPLLQGAQLITSHRNNVEQTQGKGRANPQALGNRPYILTIATSQEHIPINL